MKIVCLIICFLSFGVNLWAQKDFTRYVNPFIGTGGHGHTYPGATMPFGAIQLSPDTRIDDWDGSSGYHYSDPGIYGFSHTHLSGTGIPDYCDILISPISGEVNFNDYKSSFSHANEQASPGYYSVKLDNGITAELTATQRAGFHQYSFPEGKKANLLIDLKWRDKKLDSKIEFIGSNMLAGYRRSSSWAKDQIVYFAMEFSEPFFAANFDTQFNPSDHTKGLTFSEAAQEKLALSFDLAKGQKLIVKVAISAVDIEGAKKNLAEIPGWDFMKVKEDAKAAWNKELGKIEVSDGSEANLTNFYTALYHTQIAPNIFQDIDGRYRGMDGKIHTTDKDTNYTVFSLWDTFRAAHPLYTIIDRKRTIDFINTFIRQYEAGGRLPVWELAANETDTMIGYHAVSVIADAMAKGIEGFDYEKAYQASKHSAELDHFGLAAYKKRGFISSEDEQESVSKTLEYAYNDFCIAQMAKILAERRKDKTPQASAYKAEKLKDYFKYSYRSHSFENLFDPETGFMRPKKNGAFIKPFEPQEVTFHFTEGNSWQYSFFVPHDVSRLISLHGGNHKFSAKLDELFSTSVKLTGREQPDITGLIGQYAHGNEPSHHIIYLYNYANQPWKTQKLARRVLDEFYKPQPDGLIGNEDCGQMSAWYVLSASGFYQVNPGQPIYAIGAPIFKETKYNLENGKSFIIKAPKASKENIYIKSARLNGRPYRRSFISHEDIMQGGVLQFEMSDKPNMKWFSEAPVSKINEEIIAAPLIEAEKRVFEGKQQITIKSLSPGAKILYSIDEGKPNIPYTAPFSIDRTTRIKAIAMGKSDARSNISEANFYRKPNNWKVKLESRPNRQYTAGGDEALIDGIRGNTIFATGEWIGIQPQDLLATIDLQEIKTIKKLGGGFLQSARSWIWMPTLIEFETSEDGINFTKAAEIKTDIPAEDMEPKIKDYTIDIDPISARYIRIKAKNLGKIPSWHPGAGYDSFIFIDEILIGLR